MKKLIVLLLLTVLAFFTACGGAGGAPAFDSIDSFDALIGRKTESALGMLGLSSSDYKEGKLPGKTVNICGRDFEIFLMTDYYTGLVSGVQFLAAAEEDGGKGVAFLHELDEYLTKRYGGGKITVPKGTAISDIKSASDMKDSAVFSAAWDRSDDKPSLLQPYSGEGYGYYTVLTASFAGESDTVSIAVIKYASEE